MITSELNTAFRSKRLLFRAFENNEADKDFLFTHIENDAVITALADLAMVRPRDRNQSEILAGKLVKSTLAVMICLPKPEDSKEDTVPTPIGFIALGVGGRTLEHAHNRSTTIGICLAAAYQNQGYGGEAINWALDWAFRYGGYHRVALNAVSYNERARHLYKKLGFVEEGCARESHWHDRKWYDTIAYGILEHEWAAMRGLQGDC